MNRPNVARFATNGAASIEIWTERDLIVDIDPITRVISVRKRQPIVIPIRPEQRNKVVSIRPEIAPVDWVDV